MIRSASVHPATRRALFAAVALVAGAAVIFLAVVGTDGGPVGGDGSAAERPARNVVLIVGDGMGLAQQTLVRATSVGRRGRLSMDRLPQPGRVRTANVGGAITDSAAAATAFATGHKTVNGAVGVDREGRPLESVLDLARRAGKSTGLVTTSAVTDATPAAFGASVRDRDDQGEIARQYLEESRPNVILGGGRDIWSGNLVARSRQVGYRYVTSARGLTGAGDRQLLGLFAPQEMFEPPEEGGGRYAPPVSLATMTRVALRILSRNRRGFFLLVEEEGIDAMGHGNDAGLVIRSGRALDRAVGVVRAFARRNPGTLVLVVGDHETGGLQVSLTEPGGGNRGARFPVPGARLDLEARWRTTEHTSTDTPLGAAGPRARSFGGVYDNTEVFERVVRAARLPRP